MGRPGPARATATLVALWFRPNPWGCTLLLIGTAGGGGGGAGKLVEEIDLRSSCGSYNIATIILATACEVPRSDDPLSSEESRSISLQYQPTSSCVASNPVDLLEH